MVGRCTRVPVVGVFKVLLLGQTIPYPAFLAVHPLRPSLNVDTAKGLPGRTAGPCTCARAGGDGGIHDVGLAAGDAITLTQALVFHIGE